MRVELDKTPLKHLKQMNEPMKSRIVKALDKLEREPPLGDIKKLQGEDGFRVKVGSYRIIYYIQGDIITVTKIAPRGGAYKE
ncbi:hypothetical protein FACS1894103_4720 [Campylobacterota bacterium]|nr:hypothetical protein FACS1894103_4720 [Campylobacterota bacterium]